MLVTRTSAADPRTTFLSRWRRVTGCDYRMNAAAAASVGVRPRISEQLSFYG